MRGQPVSLLRGHHGFYGVSNYFSLSHIRVKQARLRLVQIIKGSQALKVILRVSHFLPGLGSFNYLGVLNQPILRGVKKLIFCKLFLIFGDL